MENDKKWWEAKYAIVPNSDYVDVWNKWTNEKFNKHKHKLASIVNKAMNYEFEDLVDNHAHRLYETGYIKSCIEAISSRSRYSNYVIKNLPAYYFYEDEIYYDYDRDGSIERHAYYWNADMAEYLALKGDKLFNIIDKAFNTKINSKNYNTSDKTMLALQDLLLKSLEHQKELMEYRYEKNEISKADYDAYIKKYKEYRVYAGLIAENWAKREDEIRSVKNKTEARQIKVEKIKNALTYPIKKIKQLYTENKEKRLAKKLEEARIKKETEAKELAERKNHIKETNKELEKN